MSPVGTRFPPAPTGQFTATGPSSDNQRFSLFWSLASDHEAFLSFGALSLHVALLQVGQLPIFLFVHIFLVTFPPSAPGIMGLCLVTLLLAPSGPNAPFPNSHLPFRAEKDYCTIVTSSMGIMSKREAVLLIFTPLGGISVGLFTRSAVPS